MYLQALDGEGRVLEQAEVEMELSRLLPGNTVQTTTFLPGADLRGSGRCDALRLVITDPMTGRPAVRFANREADGEDRALILWKVSQ